MSNLGTLRKENISAPLYILLKSNHLTNHSRIGEALANAVDWCNNQGLEFDVVNDNLPEIVEYYGSNSRKITCDWYIDDRNMLPEAMPNA